MASKYLGKYSTSLASRDMQIKTALKFHLTSARVTVAKKQNDNK